jgi:hypothetical protein
MSRGSSVKIVSDYGLDDQAIGVRSPAEAKNFFSILCVQTGSGAHPASCTMGTGGPFPGAKRGRGVTVTTHPHLVPRSRISWSYTSSPPKRLHGVYRVCFALLYLGSWGKKIKAGSCVRRWPRKPQHGCKLASDFSTCTGFVKFTHFAASKYSPQTTKNTCYEFVIYACARFRNELTSCY